MMPSSFFKAISARRTSIQTFATCSARIGGHREAIERSANVSRVFLLVARVDEGWVTIPSYGNKNGSHRFEPMSIMKSGWQDLLLFCRMGRRTFSPVFVCRQCTADNMKPASPKTFEVHPQTYFWI
jgi:hypothetical protein